MGGSFMDKYAQALATLTPQARSLWGKSDYGVGESWLPLYIHMSDSAGIAAWLWDSWLPGGIKNMLARAVGDGEASARKLCIFLAAVHDIGKATPIFQAKGSGMGDDGSQGLAWMPEKAGLPVNREFWRVQMPTHPIAGELILNDYLHEHGASRDYFEGRGSIAISCIVGAHHGTLPSEKRMHDREQYKPYLGWIGPGCEAWRQVQAELVGYCLSLSGLDDGTLAGFTDPCIDLPAQSLLTGLVTMADWIASNSGFFPLLSLYKEEEAPNAESLNERVQRGWGQAEIAPAWSESKPSAESYEEFFRQRFSLPGTARPRPVQIEAARIARDVEDPGIMIVEAPMGEGKTEAALSAAELLAWRHGMSGVCMALPTMATTDAMFSRVDEWLEHLPQAEGANEKSIYLAHGKAQLNEEFQGLARRTRGHYLSIGIDDERQGKWYQSESNDAFVSDWMYGRRRGMLANFVVCTIDQVLMGALCMKHLSVRQLALANKVVIIDECHAYDLYMQQYLLRVLQWLGYWQVPVILLSATLPEGQRRQMVESYIEGKSLLGRDRQLRSVQQNCVPAFRRKPAAQSQKKTDTMAGNAPVEKNAYPLITYSSGTKVSALETKPSGRHCNVDIAVIDDGLDTLCNLMVSQLAEGGCSGVICDTVSRAQDAAAALREAFGEDAVILDHSHFIDLDRMAREKELRSLLGPDATKENGKRPALKIVVGTQVLEQSLDIDFDVLVTDIAPIDLLIQRLGRVHRHNRGANESDRPTALRAARCFVRGFQGWEYDGPVFIKSITCVYDQATLLEALAVLGIDEPCASCTAELPDDIARMVRLAYSERVGNIVPDGWRERYGQAVADRRCQHRRKKERASSCLVAALPHAAKNNWTLVNLADSNEAKASDGHDTDFGPRAVRDTQETVEVMLARKTDGGGLALLPWIGNEEVAYGSMLPTQYEPSYSESLLLAQCSTRLPLSVCPEKELDRCIDELEGQSSPYVAQWQESPWLAGRLILPMDEVRPLLYEGALLGKRVRYSARDGLYAVRGESKNGQPIS